jgi:uncharacterized RDD family membrane protein YckC
MSSPNAGLATRVLAFAADAAAINAIGWFVAAMVTLGLSLLHLPEGVRDVLFGLGAVVGLVWAASYFVFFWSTTGQTPGDRLLRIRVEDADSGRPIAPGRALWRVVLLPVSAIPLCAGFLLILVDERRRALHDRLAGTIVADVGGEPATARVRARSRA